MERLIAAISNPERRELWHDGEYAFVMSRCCGAKISGPTDEGYLCENCGKVEAHMDVWNTMLLLAAFPHGTGISARNWFKFWFGLEETEMNIEWSE